MINNRIRTSRTATKRKKIIKNTKEEIISHKAQALAYEQISIKLNVIHEFKIGVVPIEIVETIANGLRSSIDGNLYVRPLIDFVLLFFLFH